MNHSHSTPPATNPVAGDPVTGRPAPRAGISARRVVLRGSVPIDGIDYVAAAAGDSPYAPGTVLTPGTLLAKPQPAWMFPPLSPEPDIPLNYTVIARHRRFMVVDKPHFLPTSSNGRLVRNTVQTRLRVAEDNPNIVPLHRLDRLTAGLVMCSTDPATRRDYHELFARRAVTKTYQARLVRPLPQLDTTFTELVLPMVKQPGSRQVTVQDTAQATLTTTRLRLISRDDPTLVEMQPVTGFTHQLRVVCHHLGAPIIGDDTYPIDKGLNLADFTHPLQLLAATMAFTDPLDGHKYCFATLQSLQSAAS
ncbi:pseudouridine synthase [Corynebacterium choanae]|uniref:RNA pseudouridylate synthase n=1 Tax=Corynebacterium choanae TaxID=1862358 RepID=A0A3G6J5K1_9CORY|nr:pseudouridine synthase [Corynebacterium choanae]AZA13219.1 Ribosomal large subunit pseudouridine synthase A [Corynebacterium choanae]